MTAIERRNMDGNGSITACTNKRTNRELLGEAFYQRIVACAADSRDGDDHNKWAARMTARGRFELMQGRYDYALRYLIESTEQLEMLGDFADPRIVQSTRFHLLRTYAALSCYQMITTRKDRKRLYETILRDEPNRNRRMRAVLLYHLGRTGYFADRLLFES